MIVDVWMIPATADTVERWMGDPRYTHGFHTTFGVEQMAARTPAQMLAEMDAAGIDRAVLTSMGDRLGEKATADRVLELCSEHPSRFLGSYCFNPYDIGPSLDRLEEMLDTGLFGGTLVLPWAFDLAPDDRRWFPLYSFAERARVPVTIQVGHTAPLFRSSLGRPMAVEEVVLSFPSLRIVLGHLGWPWVDEVIALAGKYPHVYVDTSGHSPSRIPSALLEFMGSPRGAEKVLFGSDYPALELDRLVASAKRLPLPEDALRGYLGDNALTVFEWGAK